MLCEHPITVQDKATGGALGVPCGRCRACRLNKARAWSLRICHEAMFHEKSAFVTLTYDDDKLPKNGTLVKSDCQKFFRRLRKQTGRKFRFFLGGEYGDQNRRPHYHAVIFGLGKDEQKIVSDAWGKGFVFLGDVTPDSAQYVAGYVQKKLSGPAAVEYVRRGVIPEFSLASRKPGIGADYVEKNQAFLSAQGYCVRKGVQAPLPRYYADKLFSSDEDKARIHAMRQAFIDAGRKPFVEQNGAYRYTEKVLDGRKAVANELKARQGLTRRKL